MNELIKITTNENGQRLVSARELHEKLEIKTRFSLWIEQYIKEDNKYGFENNVDFTSVVTTTVVNNGAKRNLQDYALTIDTAKEVSMVENNEFCRQARRYFLKMSEFVEIHGVKVNRLGEIISLTNKKGHWLYYISWI